MYFVGITYSNSGILMVTVYIDEYEKEKEL